MVVPKKAKKRNFRKTPSFLENNFQMSTFGLMKIVREIKQQKATGIKALAIILKAAREEKKEKLLEDQRKKILESQLLKNMKNKFE